jgi:glycosyltransferase involved in cell wall biosynthesis
LHWPVENIATRKKGILLLLVFWIELKVARLKKTKIFWTAHNLRSHERKHPLLEAIAWRVLFSNIDGIICMSDTGKRELFRHHPQTRSIPIFTIPHGHFRGAYPDVVSKNEARAALEIAPDEFVLVFIGLIRPYKGVSKLIHCFVRSQLANAKLLIAGMANDEMTREIKKAAAHSSNVKLVLKFVNRDDIQKYLRAADLVILPYIEIQNSGSALLALSFDRPILVPARGALCELRDIVGCDWVKLYEGDLSPEIIRAAVQWVKARPIRSNDRAPLDALNWERIARLTIQAFS